MFFIFFIPTVLVVLVVGFIMIFGVFGNEKSLKKERELQADLNKRSLSEATRSGFIPTRIFYIADYSTFNKSDECKKMLAVDTENKKLLVQDYSKNTYNIIDFKDFLNYELYENSSILTQGLTGGIGYFGGESKGMVRDLRIIIRFKSVVQPQIAYNLISKTILNMGVAKTSPVYRAISPTMQELISLFEVIKNENSTSSKQ